MHQSNQTHGLHGAHDDEHVHHEDSPYWRRAHRDWRFWVGLILMCAAIGTYFMSDDLSLVQSSQPQQSQSSARQK